MAVDITLIRAYTDGGVYTTDPGVTATAPTDAGTALHANFKAVGAISDDGINETTDQERQDIFIWQGNALARRIPGQTQKQWSFGASETNLMTLGVQFAGSTITQTVEGVSIAEKAPGTDIRQWVLHGIDGNKAQRIYIPLGEVTERSEVPWSSQDVTVWGWTLSAYADGSGNFAYRFIADDALAL